MNAHAALPTLNAALAALVVPTGGASVALVHADAGTALAELPCMAEQSSKPAFDGIAARGWPAYSGVEGFGPARIPTAPQVIVLLLPRVRALGRAELARAWIALPAGGWLLAAGHNDEGVRGFEKDLGALGPLTRTMSKHHGRAFWLQKAEAPDAAAQALAAQWIAADAPRLDAGSGLWLRPGVFNEGRLDGGSALLIEHLPARLGGRAADLGAGSGLLARALLERCEGVRSVDLFEAEARALDLAQRNLEGARAPVALHWHDVAQGVPGRFEVVVCNPPFHVGSRSVPALGRAFIAAAARALVPEGELWLVANRHLPYEDALRERFGHGTRIAEAGGFKVFRAWAPRA